MIFSVDGEEIILPPLHFDFTSTQDVVQIGQLADDGTYAMGVDYLSVSDYRYADPAYAWYTLTTQASTELKAREVLSSQYYVKFVLPDGVDADDIKIMSGGLFLFIRHPSYAAIPLWALMRSVISSQALR